MANSHKDLLTGNAFFSVDDDRLHLSLLDFHIRNLRIKADFTTQADDFLADVFDHALQ